MLGSTRAHRRVPVRLATGCRRVPLDVERDVGCAAGVGQPAPPHLHLPRPDGRTGDEREREREEPHAGQCTQRPARNGLSCSAARGGTVESSVHHPTSGRCYSCMKRPFDASTGYCTTSYHRKVFISESCPILVFMKVLSSLRRSDNENVLKNYQDPIINIHFLLLNIS